MRPDPLVVLTDRTQLPAGRTLVETVRSCAAAGLGTVVLRELDLREDDRAALATTLAQHVRVVSARTPLPGAVAVHLAAHQTAPGPDGPVHGRSCHDADDVARAVAVGASYVTVSPVAPSLSKPGYGPPLGPLGVRRAVAAAGRVPVLALGGVRPETAASYLVAGAHGLAVMGSVMRADDPAALVRRLLAMTR